MSNNQWNLFFVTLALAACGGSQSSTDRAQPAATSVGFQLKLASSIASPAPFRAASDGHCDMGFAVTEASINVAEIAFKSPYGNCDMGNMGMDSGNRGMGMGMGAGMVRRNRGTGSAEMMSYDGARQTGHCTGEGLVVIEGPFRINLLTGESTPALNELTLFATTYQWVDLRLASVTDARDPMFGMSVDVRGTYSGMATFSSMSTVSSMVMYSDMTTHGSMRSFPVHIAMDIANPPLRIQPTGGITIGSEGNADIQVAISSVDWFSSLDQDVLKCAAAPDAPFIGGVLQVTGETNTSCGAVSVDLRENFKNSGSRASVVVQKK